MEPLQPVGQTRVPHGRHCHLPRVPPPAVATTISFSYSSYLWTKMTPFLASRDDSG